MASRVNALVSATLESPTKGVIELRHDWRGRSVPVFVLSGGTLRMRRLERIATVQFGLRSGYHFPQDGVIEFIFDPAQHAEIDLERETIHVAGDFNGWKGADEVAWALRPRLVEGRRVWAWSGPAAAVLSQGRNFKFVTGRHQWLPVPWDAPGVEAD